MSCIFPPLSRLLFRLFFGLSCLFGVSSLAAQEVVISEFLASNRNGLRDVDGDRNDWIELRNTTAAPISLSGWYLSDLATLPTKWPFPAVTIAPNGTLLVWASEKDRRDPADQLHTNFKLAASGEFLGLFKPNGSGGLVLSHGFNPFPAQYEDISYGLEQPTTNNQAITDTTACNYLVPSNGTLDVNFGTNSNTWIGTSFTPTGWSSATLPLRFDTANTVGGYDSFSGTDIQAAMYNVRSSIYVRIPFTVSNVAELSAVKLRMRIDDGFLAYLNGVPVPVEDFNGPENEGNATTTWNSGARAEFTLAEVLVWQESELDKALLQNGNNVLCIHAFNLNAANGDFLLQPQLILSSATAAPTSTEQYFRVPTPDLGNVNGITNPGPNISETTENPPAHIPMNTAGAVATSNTQYSGTQGANNWQYGYANFSSSVAGSNLYSVGLFTPFEGGNTSGAYKSIYTTPTAVAPFNYWTGSNWDLNTAGAAPWTLVGATATHPNDSTPGPLHAAVRRWTSPVAGNYIVAGYFQRSATTGDGIFGHLFHNGVSKFSALSLGNFQYFRVPVTLAVGDILDLVVDLGPGNDDTSDSTNSQMLVLPAATAVYQPLLITSRVVPTVNPIQSVNCLWRIDQGTEGSMAMLDNGSNGDVSAGDGIYSCQLELGLVAQGKLIRWRIEAKDTTNAVTKNPPYLDPLNSVQYFGTIIQDTRTASSQLPVLHWFPVNPSNAGSARGDRGSVWYGGEFYDNVRFRLHGQSTAGFAKKSYGLDFATDNRFRYKIGEKRVRDILLLSNWADKSKVRNTLAWETFRNTGTKALFAFPVRVEQNGAFFGLYDMVEDPDDLYLERAGLADGALYKMYNNFDNATHASSGVEKKSRQHESNTDLKALLDALDTALALNARRQYCYDNMDLAALANILAVIPLITHNDQGHKNYFLYRDSTGTRQWQMLPWDLDLSFGHTWTSGPNYFDDHIDSQRGLTLGANTNRVKTMFNTQPEFSRMMLRRLRTLMDEYLGDVNATTGIFETRIATILDAIDPPTLAATQRDAYLDGQKWGVWWPMLPWNAAYGSQTKVDVASSNTIFSTVWAMHGPRPSAGRIANANGNPSTTTLADSTNNLANSHYLTSANYTSGTHGAFGNTVNPYLKGRRLRLYDTSATRLLYNGLPIPDAQPAMPNLTFYSVDYNPGAMGGLKQDAEHLILKNNEATEIDVSGWTLSGAISYTFPGGTVIPRPEPGSSLPNAANLGLLHVAKSPYHFRQRAVSPRGGENRLVTGPYNGQLSARGETVELRNKAGVLIASNTWTPAPTTGQQSLRVVEFLYAPTPATPLELLVNPALRAADFEYLMLQNIGTTSLDLTGATFTEGIRYTFGSLTLPVGGKVVVAGNLAAFALRNPSYTGTVVGPFIGDLDNGGEQIHLLDAVGESILEFTYDGLWHWPADDAGHSLRILSPNASYQTWDAPTSWGVSLAPGGLDADMGVYYGGFARIKFTTDEYANAAISGPNMDADGDGSSNLLEYSAGSQPKQNTVNLLPTQGTTMVAGAPVGTYTFRRLKNSLDLAYYPQVSSDLETWIDLYIPVGYPVDNGDGTETVTYRDETPISENSRRFFQLKVQQTAGITP